MVKKNTHPHDVKETEKRMLYLCPLIQIHNKSYRVLFWAQTRPPYRF